MTTGVGVGADDEDSLRERPQAHVTQIETTTLIAGGRRRYCIRNRPEHSNTY
jgi:hypothetical protein